MIRPNKELSNSSVSHFMVDVVHDLHSLALAAFLGRVWSYCEMRDGVCNASIDRLANDCELSYKTTWTYLKTLCEKDYLIDITPGIVNSPHTYKVSGKVVFLPFGYRFATEEEREQIESEDDEFIVDTNGQSATDLMNG